MAYAALAAVPNEPVSPWGPIGPLSPAEIVAEIGEALDMFTDIGSDSVIET